MRDQLLTREGAPTGRGIAAEAIPQPEQARMEYQRVVTKSLGLDGFREVQRAQHVALEMRLAELQLVPMRRLVRMPAVAAQHAREGIAQQGDEHVGSPRRRRIMMAVTGARWTPAGPRPSRPFHVRVRTFASDTRACSA